MLISGALALCLFICTWRMRVCVAFQLKLVMHHDVSISPCRGTNCMLSPLDAMRRALLTREGMLQIPSKPSDKPRHYEVEW